MKPETYCIWCFVIFAVYAVTLWIIRADSERDWINFQRTTNITLYHAN